MQYINAYILLEIEPGSLWDSPKEIRAAKKKVLANIELDGEVWVDGISVNKSTALKVFDDLDDESKCRFHANIFFDNSFRLFLTKGDTGWFYSDEPEEYIFFKNFIAFVSPCYIYQFDRALGNAIECGDIDLVKALENCSSTIAFDNFESAYKSARKYFVEKLRELEEAHENLKSDGVFVLPSGVELYQPTTPFYNPFNQPSRIGPISKFEKSLLEHSDLQIINGLPDEFQLLRDDIAASLRNIAVEVNNQHNEPQIALLIFRHVEKLIIGSRIKDLINSDILVLQQIILRENLEQLNSQLENLKGKIKERHFTSAAEITKIIDTVFDVSELNKISSRENNSAIIRAAMQISEIAWGIYLSYLSPDEGIEVIEKCLQLKLSDSSVSSSLLKKLVEIRTEIDRSRDLIIPTESQPKKRTPPTRKAEYKNVSEKESNQARKKTLNESKQYSSRKVYSSKTNVFDTYQQHNSSTGIFSSLITNLKSAGLGVNLTILGVGLISVLILGSIIFAAFSAGRISQTVSTNEISNQNANQVSSQTPTDLLKINQKPNISSTPLQKIIRPASGTVLAQESKKGGWGKLSITNDLDKDAVAKLIDSASGKTYREIYIHARSKISLNGIRPADYSLIFATGKDYAPAVGKFLRDSAYSKFDRTFNYAESRNQYGVGYREYQVTLNPVAYGTATTSNIGENDFIDK